VSKADASKAGEGKYDVLARADEGKDDALAEKTKAKMMCWPRRRRQR
jgi:hypothetical protein